MTKNSPAQVGLIVDNVDNTAYAANNGGVDDGGVEDVDVVVEEGYKLVSKQHQQRYSSSRRRQQTHTQLQYTGQLSSSGM